MQISEQGGRAQLVRTWAENLKGTGIRVDVLSPGATATELAKAALGEEGQKAYGAMTPLLRMAVPSEIAAAAFAKLQAPRALSRLNGAGSSSG